MVPILVEFLMNIENQINNQFSTTFYFNGFILTILKVNENVYF